MIKIRKKRKFDQTAEITSLIDIVFILLIFFLLTAVFIPEGVSINLPEAKNTTDQAENPLTIFINDQGSIFINDQNIQIENLSSEIMKLKEDHPISINADQKSDYGIFIKVIDEIKSRGNHPLILTTDSIKK
jgi:biopolymer transport protein ExbD